MTTTLESERSSDHDHRDGTPLSEIKDEILNDHWRWSYSWRGVQLDLLEKRYNRSGAEILSILREIAHSLDPPDAEIKRLPRCRSCGMRIVWGKSENGKTIPLDPKILHIISAQGQRVSGRESHFVSCPNAEGHRK